MLYLLYFPSIVCSLIFNTALQFMTTPLDSMQFYTRVLTGMLLLLNLGLLMAIRMALKQAKHCRAIDASDEGLKRWNGAKRGLSVLAILVVGMNGAAIFANHRMANATQDLMVEMSDPPGLEVARSATPEPPPMR
jgi:hypothetical protein